MPSIYRFPEVEILDLRTVKLNFSFSINNLLSINDILIHPTESQIPVPKIISAEFSSQEIILSLTPLWPIARYQFEILNLSIYPNTMTILTPSDPENKIRDNLIQKLEGNIYNLEPGTLLYDLLDQDGQDFLKIKYDIQETKNQNYLSFEVRDELKTRGVGPFDRLNEESAYQILKVSKNQSETFFPENKKFSPFPSEPVALNSVTVEEILTNQNFQNLTFSVLNFPIIKINSITFVYQSGEEFEYSISKYGYQLNNSRYDQYARTFLGLQENQFRLNDLIWQESLFQLPNSNERVIVSYDYISKGREIDFNSLQVYEVKKSVRQIIPPITNQFDLKFYPIVSSEDMEISSGGVLFLDPQSNPPFASQHPAFVNEIPYQLENLPSKIGQYSIDYSSGRVFVYGATSNDGTGAFPPVADYYYRSKFINQLDFNLDQIQSELVANSQRDLIGKNISVSFLYQDNLIEGKDYISSTHHEILEERIENRLKSNQSLTVKNIPITNVFRVYNETTGEIYQPTRWNRSTIYFNSNISPRIEKVVRETVNFVAINNEILSDFSIIQNSFGTIWKFKLLNQNISNSSEDALGSSLNSSVTFTSELFLAERYFDSSLELINNLDFLTEENHYLIDYKNGIIYLFISSAPNDFNFGSVNYKILTIQTSNHHLTAINDLYFSRSVSETQNKKINYLNFSDSQITFQNAYLSNERQNSLGVPYFFDSGNIVVEENIYSLRGIYDHYQISNQTAPLNFSSAASFSFNTISFFGGIERQETLTITNDLKLIPSYYSPGIEIQSVVGITRNSDSAILNGTLSNGEVILSGLNSPQPNQEVTITYVLIPNGAFTPVVDYSRGQFCVDYEYLADEILVSYEYGDNSIDFSQNTNLFPGEKYYVTYLVGALRAGLLANFGSLTQIPILQTLDLNLPRERYRDALMAILQAFPKGPTLEAIKKLVYKISHVNPIIEESAFLLWSLGLSQFYPSKPQTFGEPKLIAARNDFGLLFDQPNQSIQLPLTSHLRLEEGTIEFWVTPEWQGLDNQAKLTFELKIDGNLVQSEEVFLGSESKNPEIGFDGCFSCYSSDLIGLPGKIFTAERGYFIYFDPDQNLWKFLVKNPTNQTAVFSGKIFTSGEFYSVRSIEGLGEIGDTIRTSNKKVEFQFVIDSQDSLNPDGYVDGYTGHLLGYSFDGLEFISDQEYYFFDAGDKLNLNQNRLSIYRDGKGYLNFRVFAKNGLEAKVSANISDWKKQSSHFIAASWKLNTLYQKDELHLFIDGQEVPNISRYSDSVTATASEKYRTIIPEILTPPVTVPVIGGNDLSITGGFSSVYCARNLQALGVLPGQTIRILETGFGEYSILSVNQNTLVLDSSLPFSLENAKFSINPVDLNVFSDLHLIKNFTVSARHVDNSEDELFGLRSDLPDYGFYRNIYGQNILSIYNGLISGDRVAIRTLGLNFRTLKDQKYIWNETSILKTKLSPPANLDEVKIKKILFSPRQCQTSNLIDPLLFQTTFSEFSSITNPVEGRQIAFYITGQNVNFSLPVTITVNGESSLGPISEVLQFSTPGKIVSQTKFTEINSITIYFLRWEPKPGLVFWAEEEYSITESNGNDDYAVIKYAIQNAGGNNLQSVTLNQVQDQDGYYSNNQIGDQLIISSPPSVAGNYEIVSVIDQKTLEISPALPTNFISGNYQIYHLLDARSGLQNGYFFFQTAGTINEPYLLSPGEYKIEYPIYLFLPFDSFSGQEKISFGSDLTHQKPSYSVLDNCLILSECLTDVRRGEKSIIRTVTSDYNSILSPQVTPNTITYLNCNSLPVIDQSANYVRYDGKYLQASISVNQNFGWSVNLGAYPIELQNQGYLNSNEGTIEFWISPEFDTANDPEKRYYFDATSATKETVLSLTKNTLKLESMASQILDLRFSDGSVVPGKYALQSDKKTILLEVPLSYQNIPIEVYYFPIGLIGNRISIYKDNFGFLVFEIQSAEKTFTLRQPIFWAQNSWHRVMAIYSCNKLKNSDYLRLLIDGEEKANFLFGEGILFGAGKVFGESKSVLGGLKGDIQFLDPINYLYFGSDYRENNRSACRIDNLRLSNQARQPTIIAGHSKDLNYNSNLELCFPVIEDLYTTLILDYDSLSRKADDFTLLKNKNFGLSSFEIQVIDSFDIVLSSEKVKTILETLIYLLKPAHSKVKISYSS